MNLIIGGRGVGKTHKMLEWLRQSRTRVLLVATEDRAEELRGRLGEDETEVAARITSLGNIQSHRQGYKTWGVDDADHVLRTLLGGVVLQMSFGEVPNVQHTKSQDNPIGNAPR